jgi:hypothetical protein
VSTASRTHLSPITSLDDLDLFTKSGVVIDRQADSETQVYGSVTNGHGRISSSTTDYLTLFLRKDDGDEFSVVLQDFAVQARVGNRVSIIFAGNKNSDWGREAGFLNHDTGREAIREATIESLAPGPRVAGRGCLLIVAPILVFAGFFQVTATVSAFGGVSGVLSLLLGLATLASPIVTFMLMRKDGKRRVHQATALQSQIRAAIKQQIDAARSAPPSTATS